MKKLFSLIIMCLIGTMSLFAQTNPNRVIITEKSGNVKSFLAERIDSTASGSPRLKAALQPK